MERCQDLYCMCHMLFVAMRYPGRNGQRVIENVGFKPVVRIQPNLLWDSNVEYNYKDLHGHWRKMCKAREEEIQIKACSRWKLTVCLLLSSTGAQFTAEQVQADDRNRAIGLCHILRILSNVVALSEFNEGNGSRKWERKARIDSDAPKSSKFTMSASHCLWA